MITKFKIFNESVGDYKDKVVGTEVNISDTKLLYDADGGFIDLGVDVSGITIQNLKRKYPDGEIIDRNGKTFFYIKPTPENILKKDKK
ncbi:hypothetical protein M0Q50_04835 [bacterium]|jgi:hypothetical protein|nr:hypothetical protein [bacterium]